MGTFTGKGRVSQEGKRVLREIDFDFWREEGLRDFVNLGLRYRGLTDEKAVDTYITYVTDSKVIVKFVGNKTVSPTLDHF